MIRQMISAQHITLTYHSENETVKALNDINLEVPETGLIGIIGPSGSGKTSLLYVLAGIRKATNGKVIYDPKLTNNSSLDISQLRRTKMGFVFQSHFLISYLPILKNILVGAEKISSSTVATATKLLKEVGLEGYDHRLPHELSGGQRQRAAIARALINSPKVLFVDEPTASLDKVTAQEVVNLLERLSKDVSVIVVTHDPLVIAKASHTYQLRNGELA